MKCCLALSCSAWHRVDLSQEDSSGFGSKKNLRLPPQSARHGGLWSVVPPSTTEDWESSKLGTRTWTCSASVPSLGLNSPPPGPPVFSSGTLRLRGKFPACTWDLCGPERWRNLEVHKHPDFQKEGRSCGQEARLLLTLGSPLPLCRPELDKVRYLPTPVPPIQWENEAQRREAFHPRLYHRSVAKIGPGSNSHPSTYSFLHFRCVWGYSHSSDFSISHVWMSELDHKEGWVPKKSCFWTVVLENTLKSPLDCKEIKPINPKGNQPWIFIGRTNAEAEAPILWPPDAKSWVIEKDPDAGKDWRQEEKGETEEEIIGWHHWLNGHEFEQTPGDSEG